MALLATLFAGAFFLLGALIAWRVHDRAALEAYSVAIAFGSLALVAATDLLPEAIEAAEELGWLPVFVLVIGGVLALVALDRLMPDHHAGEGEEGKAHLGAMAVLAVSVHNLAEGAAIFTIASQDISAGMALAFGVGLHNAPMGMLLYSTMEHNRARGIVVLAVASLSTFVGGFIMFALGGVIDEAITLGVVCVALGMIVYILFAELLPAMVRGGDVKRSVIGIVIGAAFVLAGMFLE